MVPMNHTTDHTDEPPTTTGIISLTAAELVEHINAIRKGANAEAHKLMALECMDYLARGL